jgi:putative membrane protein
MTQPPDRTVPSDSPGISSAPQQAVEKTWLRRLLDGFLSFLGFTRWAAPREIATVAPDKGTQLAEERTDLALKRTYWAAERTLLAWVRTAISMISFGFTIGKIGQAITAVEVRGLQGMGTLGVGSVAYLLVTLGTLSLLAAAVQFYRRAEELREQGLVRRPSLAFGVALVLCLLGAVAFSSLVLKL